MSSLILCHKRHAKQPYEITRIHRRIYTIEELVYYLCNHLYLIDYTIMNENLCDTLNTSQKKNNFVTQFKNKNNEYV